MGAMSSCVRNDIILANGSHVIHTGDDVLANGDNVLAEETILFWVIAIMFLRKD